MARRNILSQMFDVRPRDSRGELDVERIQKIRDLLDLARKNKNTLKLSDDYESHRIIDLKNKIIEALASKPLFEKALQRKKKISSFSDEQVLKSLLSGNSFGLDNASLPTREEIEEVLNEIEMFNQYLKESALDRENEGQGEFVEQGESDTLTQEMAFNLDEFLMPEPPESIEIDITEPAVIEAKIEEFSLDNFLNRESFSGDDFVSETPVNKIVDENLTEAKKEIRPDFFSKPSGLRQNKINLIWFKNQIKILDVSPRLRRGVGFALVGILAWILIFGLSITARGLSAKSSILVSGQQAYQAMMAGTNSASQLDFSAAQANFSAAYQSFIEAEQELNKMGGAIVSILEQLPGGSKVKSGEALIEAGKNLAKAGTNFSKIGSVFVLENIGSYFSEENISLTQKIFEIQTELAGAKQELTMASENLNKVDPNDLSEDLASSIGSLKEKLPLAIGAVNGIVRWSDIFLGIFGRDQAKKYILVFQNTAEARATGGFIGSYGVLDLDQGKIKKLFVDNVFNLDGQLYEKVIPPKPIQKISTAWSLHDSNWFADFPLSAQKILWFYEKAGGATADGVISLTPAVIERLLGITGPIEMSEYNVIFSQENFVDLLQQKVEVDYDKLENKPKQILADFAPRLLDKLWEIWPQKYEDIFQVFADSLEQKDILFYFSDLNLQSAFGEQGWTGEILNADNDYLSVVNSNINGFKTDKMVEQKISHFSQVQKDGSIINTLKITRTHTGGKSQYNWYNRVNANYMRVYVPLGSKLLSAQGQTLEGYNAPTDYQKLNFKIDPDVAAQEQAMSIDPNSGTQIFEESGKTVFGNWVYASPGETVEVTYKYLLPSKLDLGSKNFSWSLLAQKQSGGAPSVFESILVLPQEYKINWRYPKDIQISGNQIKFNGDLATDKFYGLVFGQK